VLSRGAKFGIGTGVRKPLAEKNLNPGPGQYQEGTTLKRKGAKFYSEKRVNRYGNKNPGPGMYENKTGIEESIDKTKGYSIGLKLEKLKGLKVVGPGAYCPDFKSSKKNSGTVKFGSSERVNKYDTKTPGPGTYESKGTNEAS